MPPLFRSIRSPFFLISALLAFFQGSVPLHACTNFQLKALDNSILIARSMEFAIDLKSQILAIPKGYDFVSAAPSGGKGASWKGRYGFIGFSGFELPVVLDGVNEAGLSIESLWLPESQYQSVPAGQETKAVAVQDFGNWLLSQFSTVEEVRQALGNAYVWGNIVPQLGYTPPLHTAIHDASGKNLVVEYLNGQVTIHDNPIGALTNSPSFPWQVTNLRNYVNLTPSNAMPRTVSGVELKATGQGSGLLGLPGDYTPPSRFVRAAIFSHAVNPAATYDKAVNLGFHILNTFDIPRGVIRDTASQAQEYTQWAVVKDLTHRSLYLHTYDDLTIRKVDLSALEGVSTPFMKTLDLKTLPPAKP